jgi:hypothetical protein
MALVPPGCFTMGKGDENSFDFQAVSRAELNSDKRPN